MNDLTMEQCRRLLTDSMVGHLGVIADGEPYVSPISYVFLDASIWIRTGIGRRVEAIRDHPRVCVEVSEYDEDTGNWQSVIVWGDAVRVEDDATARRVIIAILEKYRDVLGSPLSRPGSPSEPEVVIQVPLEEVSGRTSGSFFSLRSRPGRL